MYYNLNCLVSLALAISLGACSAGKRYNFQGNIAQTATLQIDGSQSAGSVYVPILYFKNRHTTVHVHRFVEPCKTEYLGAFWSSNNKTTTPVNIPAGEKMYLFVNSTVETYKGNIEKKVNAKAELFFNSRQGSIYLISPNDKVEGFFEILFLEKVGNKTLPIKSTKNLVSENQECKTGIEYGK